MQIEEFYEGMKVRLPKKVPTIRLGFPGWDNDMNKHLGKKTTVTDVDTEDRLINVKVDNGDWVWAYEWVEKL